jgi:hypothetical protein
MRSRVPRARARARAKDDRDGESDGGGPFCSLLIPRHSFGRSNLPGRRQFNLQPNTLLCLT